MFDRLAIAALLAGCNQIYGLDRTQARDAGTAPGELLIDVDRDGISDEADDCIASTRDGEDDVDTDRVPASRDGCPFDSGGTS